MFVIVICLASIGYSLTVILSQWNDYQKSAQGYEELLEVYKAPGLEQENVDQEERMKEINHDYLGWISIGGTKINYPVVKGLDNSYYLNHNFYKKKDFVGSIFMDYRNTGTDADQHTIIYGHNMKDKSMFGSLKQYLNPEYYENHKIIQFDFQGQSTQWEIFSMYISNDTYLLETEFPTVQSFEKFLIEKKGKSVSPIPTNVGADDKVLTLSTCTTNSDSERMIVHAKLIRGK